MSDPDEPTTPEEHLARAQARADEQRARNAEVAGRATTVPVKPAIPDRLRRPRTDET